MSFLKRRCCHQALWTRLSCKAIEELLKTLSTYRHFLLNLDTPCTKDASGFLDTLLVGFAFLGMASHLDTNSIDNSNPLKHTALDDGLITEQNHCATLLAFLNRNDWRLRVGGISSLRSFWQWRSCLRGRKWLGLLLRFHFCFSRLN